MGERRPETYRVIVRRSKHLWTWEIEREEDDGTFWAAPEYTRGCRGWAFTEQRAMAKGRRRVGFLQRQRHYAEVRSCEVIRPAGEVRNDG